MEKKHKNPPGNVCPRVPIMHGINFYSAGFKYHLTIKKTLYVRILGSLTLEVWLPDYNIFPSMRYYLSVSESHLHISSQLNSIIF